MKSRSRRNVDDERGRKPAKDGPGFQVDGPRAWGWHLRVAGAEARGQAGRSATRAVARAGGGRGGLRTGTSGEPEVREYWGSRHKGCLLVLRDTLRGGRGPSPNVSSEGEAVVVAAACPESSDCPPEVEVVVAEAGLRLCLSDTARV